MDEPSRDDQTAVLERRRVVEAILAACGAPAAEKLNGAAGAALPIALLITPEREAPGSRPLRARPRSEQHGPPRFPP